MMKCSVNLLFEGLSHGDVVGGEKRHFLYFLLLLTEIRKKLLKLWGGWFLMESLVLYGALKMHAGNTNKISSE